MDTSFICDSGYKGLKEANSIGLYKITIRGAEQVARMGEMKKSYKILDEKSEGTVKKGDLLARPSMEGCGRS
jgi:hypothetical protein